MPIGSDPSRRADERKKRFEQPPSEPSVRPKPKAVEFMPIRKACNNCSASPRQHDVGEGCNAPSFTYRFVPRPQ